MHNSRGFTIVELLIVIVVIGILAAITIVAFNGIQERARVASGIAFAAQIKRQNLQDVTGNWTFDECSGSTANSSSENNANGTFSSAVTWSTDTPSGRGCSLSFDGSSSARVLTDATLSSTYYMKAAWVKLNSCSSSNNILSMKQAGVADSALYAPACQVRGGHNSAYTQVMSSVTLSTNKWYHVAMEYVDSTLKLYIDGKVVATATGIPAPANASVPGVSIGSHSGGNNMNGLIDEPIVIAR